MGFFEHELERAVMLALFIPLIISAGGNAGSQATTLLIRAMALGEVRLADWWRVMRRETMAGLTLGLILGILRGSPGTSKKDINRIPVSAAKLFESRTAGQVILSGLENDSPVRGNESVTFALLKRALF